MCGICGFISNRIISHDALQRMNDTMIHRGPNDSGVEIYPYAGVRSLGLAQRRLSILDLSALGHQPMTSAGGDVTVVFNGEIYNYRDLQRELTEYPFQSSCDTEVILAAYLKWGIDFVNRLNGMFAIALYDRRSGDLYLIRDRIGKKPLYYWIDGDNIVFGSELKPIMACPGFEGKIDRRVLVRYLCQQYIDAPYTVFQDVFKLEPGAVLHYSNGKVEVSKYWDLARVYEKQAADPVKSFDEAKDGLKAELQAAVKRRMISDVPLGTFLSGGYDSSLVTALMAEESTAPVKTFSIGFSDPAYDESPYAAAVAKHLGTDHTSVIIEEREMLDLVDSISQYYDEPFADSSQIPSMLVAELAKKYVTVVLTGDGGDEFYCGYNIYTKVQEAQRLDGLGGLAYGLGRLPIGHGRHFIDAYPFSVRTIAENRNRQTKTQLGSNYYEKAAYACVLGRELTDAQYLSERARGSGVSDFLSIKKPIEEHYNTSNWAVKRMLLDMETYLPGDILCKVDRATMKYSLEGRCPLLDRDVMEYSFRIPQKYKLYKGDKKHILKSIAYDYIPKELLDRPKKGFSVPIDKWLRGPLCDRLGGVSQPEYLKQQGLFDSSYVSSYIQDYLSTGDAGPGTGRNPSGIVWAFFVFQIWWERYLKA